MIIFLDGHKGLVGSAILRKLRKKKYKKVITICRKNLNLLSKSINEEQKKFNIMLSGGDTTKSKISLYELRVRLKNEIENSLTLMELIYFHDF